MRSVGSHSMSGREKEGNKERTGQFEIYFENMKILIQESEVL